MLAVMQSRTSGQGIAKISNPCLVELTLGIVRISLPQRFYIEALHSINIPLGLREYQCLAL